MTANQTPADVHVHPRHLKFELHDELATLWHGNDVFKTAFFNAMSLQFPDGEHLFIKSVRDFRDEINDPELLKNIKGFIGQEGIHSREHAKYNEALRQRGYDIDYMEKRFQKHMAFVGGLNRDRRLAGTCAAEHFTAVLAKALLEIPEAMDGVSPEMQALWKWHAIEEIEHKSVAFDVFVDRVGNHRMRTIIFFVVSYNFFKFTFLNTCSMLKTEGKLWDLKTWWGGMQFLWGRPGVIRKMMPHFLAYLKKDFHPWQEDNRQHIEAWKKTTADLSPDSVPHAHSA
ncbi:metal-dependent hydrolase [Oleiphilus messinensis]|uniref:Metal-dependent hydrolase n=1 Tax=Oleiphilus messinensis TaxID=141451 RepID=A0A1Y0IGJ6_9GAMM|nr:metal-dependent hydrolase [Oleiphilus messinensis]ARU58645.1 metal-dependent hydrolase [Oleiphilus messinensis]